MQTSSAAASPTSTLRPLLLTPTIHPPYPSQTCLTSTESSTTSSTSSNSEPSTTTNTLPINPFAEPLPTSIPSDYLTTTAATPGLNTALYTLVPLSSDQLANLLNTLAFHALCVDSTSAIVLAPTHDFSSRSESKGGGGGGGGCATLADILTYHTALLSVVAGNPWNLSATRFLVLPDAAWEANGLLLVDLDAHPDADGRGVVGVARMGAEVVGRALVLREKRGGEWGFVDFKVIEGEWGREGNKWRDVVVGYEGSKWESLGREWWERGIYGQGGDDGWTGDGDAGGA